MDRLRSSPSHGSATAAVLGLLRPWAALAKRVTARRREALLCAAVDLARGRELRESSPRATATEASQSKARISGASARPEISASVALLPSEDHVHSR